MEILLVKSLSDCLQTAHEIHEYLTHGELGKALALARKLIDQLDACLRDTLRNT